MPYRLTRLEAGRRNQVALPGEKGRTGVNPALRPVGLILSPNPSANFAATKGGQIVLKKWQRIVAVVMCLVFIFAVASPALAAITHRVSRGETLWLISRRYNTTVGAIQAANNYWSSTIYPGQVLTIPGSGGAGHYGYSSSDVYLLAQLIRAEAENQPYAGKVAVGAVVLNRVRSPRFPNTIRGVIYQPGQFEPVSNGRIYRPARSVDLQAARDAVNGWDPTGGALYFFNHKRVSNRFLWSRPWKTTIGDHRFVA